MLKKILNLIIIPVLFLFLGIIIGSPIWLRNSEWLKWDQLNLSNVISILSLVVNTIIAIVVVFVLQKLQDIQRVEKNILITRVDEEVKNINEFVNRCCTSDHTDFSSITSFFKTSNIRINKITNTHSNCGKESKVLIENITVLNSLLTDPNETSDLVINNNRISLKLKRIQEIKIQMAEVQNQTLCLILCINSRASKK